MTARERILQLLTLASIVLHLLAAVAEPGALWGLSHLAVFPLPVAVGWSLLAAASLFLLPRWIRGVRDVGFPGHRASLGIALLCGALFWLLRERTHFFGDGYLLIRDRGFSETAARAPLLVEATTRVIVAAGSSLDLDAGTTMALLSVSSGVVGVYLLLRLCVTLTDVSSGRFLLVALLGTAGSLQLFFGHVEYYPMVAAAVLGYVLLATYTLTRGRTQWMTLPAYAALVPLHLSALALAPAQLVLTGFAWRARRRATLLAASAGAAILWVLPRLVGGRAESLAATSVAGLKRYTAPYTDVDSARFAFAFLDTSHLLAVANDVLLGALMAVVMLPLLWWRRHARVEAVHLFLGVAAAGCFLFNFVFYRELGAYRDWDILAPYGFVYLAFAGAMWVRPQPRSLRVPLVVILVGGLHHSVPWTLLNARRDTAMTHHRLVLAQHAQWSPFARGYMHESLAIHHRNRGEDAQSLRDYENAVHANPADARYRIGLGNEYFKQGRLEAALEQFTLAVETRPDYAGGHNNLAFCLAEMGHDLARARRHAERAVVLQPEVADFWMTLATIEHKSRRTEAARRAAERALELRRPFAEAEQLLRALRSGNGGDDGDDDDDGYSK